jgi:hypothetical protein
MWRLIRNAKFEDLGLKKATFLMVLVWSMLLNGPRYRSMASYLKNGAPLSAGGDLGYLSEEFLYALLCL